MREPDVRMAGFNAYDETRADFHTFVGYKNAEGKYECDYYVLSNKINSAPEVYDTLEEAEYAGGLFVLVYGFSLAKRILEIRGEEVPSDEVLRETWKSIIDDAAGVETYSVKV